MKGFVYIVLNSVNGKAYVGQTERTIQTRWTQHKSQAKAGIDYPLYRAMRKYGFEKFQILELASSDVVFLNDLEKLFIRVFRTSTLEFGYNLSEGGKGPSGMRSIETRRRVSLSLIGNKRSLGRKHSAETIRKMSAAHKFNPVAYWKGKKLSLETRMRMSETRRNRNRTESIGDAS